MLAISVRMAAKRAERSSSPSRCARRLRWSASLISNLAIPWGTLGFIVGAQSATTKFFFKSSEALGDGVEARGRSKASARADVGESRRGRVTSPPLKPQYGRGYPPSRRLHARGEER